jgi:hypothetical protein
MRRFFRVVHTDPPRAAMIETPRYMNICYNNYWECVGKNYAVIVTSFTARKLITISNSQASDQFLHQDSNFEYAI